MSKSCHFCEGIVKDYIEIEGGWMLSHWSGEKEKYLGRLVMATKQHRRNWNDLSLLEATTFGTNIQRINGCLRKYWAGKYPDDSIEQVYVVYFNDAPYKKEKPILEEVFTQLHVHLHLLTRTKEMREALKNNYKNLGWKLIDCIGCFPDKYKISEKDENKVTELMDYLRVHLVNKK